MRENAQSRLAEATEGLEDPEEEKDEVEELHSSDPKLALSSEIPAEERTKSFKKTFVSR